MNPGEAVRVTGIRDVVEPRVKFGGDAQVFPGVLGPVTAVGDGLTHRLSGMAVLATAAYEGTVRAGTGVQRSAILDMWGSGAEASRFSALTHLVLILQIKAGLGELEAHHAIQQAEFEVARKVAETTQGLAPTRTGDLRLERRRAAAPADRAHPGLHHPSGAGAFRHGLLRSADPRVAADLACIPTSFSMARSRLIRLVVLLIIQPVGTGKIILWFWDSIARNPRGKLGFAGVILERISYETHQAKEVVAHNAAQLAHSLGADAALITWTGSGNAFVEVMLTIRACERLGIKTVLVTYEYGGKDGVDSPLLFYAAEANAVVSTGSRDRWIDLPEPERVVGPYDAIRVLSYPGAPSTPARAALTLDARDMIIGGVDNWGRRDWTCAAY